MLTTEYDPLNKLLTNRIGNAFKRKPNYLRRTRSKGPRPLRIAWVLCQILASSLLLALFFRLHFEKRSLSICCCGALSDKVLGGGEQH